MNNIKGAIITVVELIMIVFGIISLLMKDVKGNKNYYSVPEYNNSVPEYNSNDKKKDKFTINDFVNFEVIVDGEIQLGEKRKGVILRDKNTDILYLSCDGMYRTALTPLYDENGNILKMKNFIKSHKK